MSKCVKNEHLQGAQDTGEVREARVGDPLAPNPARVHPLDANQERQARKVRPPHLQRALEARRS